MHQTHAAAEAANNLHKTELIRQEEPRRNVEQAELAILEGVWWWNDQRLHGKLDLRIPTEVGNVYYVNSESAKPVPAGPDA